ncbi:hypothetical protein LCGC14_2612070 [marine sediment metagenome]|uniref:Uncharacterized protein n=1 Tax=marine sediment metagenome TaxID=412755 RepID=A0A0F9CY87_9ZZZZ
MIVNVLPYSYASGWEEAMTCECSGCLTPFDPEKMSHCEECDGYFCPSCWDDHDTEEGCPDALAVP